MIARAAWNVYGVVGGSCYGAGTPESVGVKIGSNVVLGNDIGVWLSNIDVDPNNSSLCIPTAVVTKAVVAGNIIMNDAVNNTSGYGAVGSGYQAGISDQGNYDYLGYNSICGAGYTPVATPPPYLYTIDTTATNNPTVIGNTSCSGGSSLQVARPSSHPDTRLKASALR